MSTRKLSERWFAKANSLTSRWANKSGLTKQKSENMKDGQQNRARKIPWTIRSALVRTMPRRNRRRVAPQTLRLRPRHIIQRTETRLSSSSLSIRPSRPKSLRRQSRLFGAAIKSAAQRAAIFMARSTCCRFLATSTPTRSRCRCAKPIASDAVMLELETLRSGASWRV